jgi:hypothetical protein
MAIKRLPVFVLYALIQKLQRFLDEPGIIFAIWDDGMPPPQNDGLVIPV